MSQAGAAAIEIRKVGRNDPCPCGSGLKFKHCCQTKQTGASVAASRPGQPPPPVAHAIQAHLRAATRLREAGRLEESIAALREIARLDPLRAEAHHDLGLTCLRCGHMAEAAASLQRAVELRPGFPSALSNLADALDRQGREQEALGVYHRASRAAEDPIERGLNLAKALLIEGKLTEAEQELRRLLALAPERAGPHYYLGHVLSLLGRFEEVVRHLTRAIELAPEAPFAFHDLTIAKRMTEADRPLVARMGDLAARPTLDEPLRINLHFGLGKAFDDLGERATAMQHYDAANRLKAKWVRLDRAGLVRHFDSLIAGFSAEALERTGRLLARPASPGDDMPVLILGMPRSGTTLVEQVLSSHPAVGAGGELSFWKDRIDGWQASKQRAVEAPAVAQAAGDYRTKLRGIAPGALRVTDKTPGNFSRIWLIRLAFPEARIIHCRRHPVDTCLSIFFTHFKGLQDYAYDRGDLVFYYRQYQRLMDHWRRVVPPDRFMDVDYERLIADREAMTRRLVAFCGLEWDDACLAPERNQRAVNTASRWQARQPVYSTSVERWRRYEPWLGELRELLAEAAPAEQASA